MQLIIKKKLNFALFASFCLHLALSFFSFAYCLFALFSNILLQIMRTKPAAFESVIYTTQVCSASDDFFDLLLIFTQSLL